MNYATRIRAREQAREILSVLLEDNKDDQDFLIGVSQACREVADIHFPAIAPLYNDFVMENGEARKFEKQQTLVGEFSGKTIGETPIIQLAEASDQTDDLKRYLRSKRAQYRWDLEVPEDDEADICVGASPGCGPHDGC